MKKTKVICTLGPACEAVDTIKAMLKEGMNAARFNFSHGTYEEHKGRLRNFMQAREETGAAAAAVLDTKGPEIRIGNVRGDRLFLEENQKFYLSCHCGLMPETDMMVGISYKNLCNEVDKGDTILIDDGKIELKVDYVENRIIKCTVVRGGYISSNKGVNVPGVRLAFDYLTDRDRKDILFGIKNHINYIAASFIRSKKDVLDIRSFLDENGGRQIEIISKIENKDGIDNFDEILSVSDGIMIARGDMGVEISYDRLPGIQKKIIRKCNECGKLVITATQMLDSMTQSLMPTRAEITDVANAVFDGTSAVMLSGESAAGRYPVETVKAMSKIIVQAEKDMNSIEETGRALTAENRNNVSDAIGHAACTMAEHIKAAALVAVTASGYTAQKMSKFRPKQPIFAVTSSMNTYNNMSLVRGVYPVLIERNSVWKPMYEAAMKKISRDFSFSSGDHIIVSAGIPINIEGNTNMIKVETVE